MLHEKARLKIYCSNISASPIAIKLVNMIQHHNVTASYKKKKVDVHMECSLLGVSKVGIFCHSVLGISRLNLDRYVSQACRWMLGISGKVHVRNPGVG